MKGLVVQEKGFTDMKGLVVQEKGSQGKGKIFYRIFSYPFISL